MFAPFLNVHMCGLHIKLGCKRKNEKVVCCSSIREKATQWFTLENTSEKKQDWTKMEIKQAKITWEFSEVLSVSFFTNNIFFNHVHKPQRTINVQHLQCYAVPSEEERFLYLFHNFKQKSSETFSLPFRLKAKKNQAKKGHPIHWKGSKNKCRYICILWWIQSKE
jgi:hypothetical protein